MWRTFIYFNCRCRNSFEASYLSLATEMDLPTILPHTHKHLHTLLHAHVQRLGNNLIEKKLLFHDCHVTQCRHLTEMVRRRCWKLSVVKWMLVPATFVVTTKLLKNLSLCDFHQQRLYCLCVCILCPLLIINFTLRQEQLSRMQY